MQTPSSPTFRLGFDGGGTKTRAVVIDARNVVLGAGESGASNPYAVGMSAALDNIEAAADLALAQAQVPRNSISKWGLGIGGVCSPSESTDLEQALRQRLGEGPQIIAAEDVVAAWSGAFGGEVGDAPRVLCIAGTGSNCWGKNELGETANADGAGPLLGDRGSGFWIGEMALRHAARVADGILEADDLATATLAHFDAADIKQLIRIVYAPDFERSHIASLVPVVLKHSHSGAGLDILRRAGAELAQTSLAVLKRLSRCGDVEGEVALIGSVLAYAEPVKASFIEVLQFNAPKTRLVEAQHEPAVGAAILH